MDCLFWAFCGFVNKSRQLQVKKCTAIISFDTSSNCLHFRTNRKAECEYLLLPLLTDQLDVACQSKWEEQPWIVSVKFWQKHNDRTEQINCNQRNSAWFGHLKSENMLMCTESPPTSPCIWGRALGWHRHEFEFLTNPPNSMEWSEVFAKMCSHDNYNAFFYRQYRIKLPYLVYIMNLLVQTSVKID